MTNDKFRQEAEENYPFGEPTTNIAKGLKEARREAWIAAREFSAAELAEKDKQIEQLREALEAAVSVIKQWHNADEVWDIYFNHAPEMKPIRTALENTKPINQ